MAVVLRAFGARPLQIYVNALLLAALADFVLGRVFFRSGEFLLGIAGLPISIYGWLINIGAFAIGAEGLLEVLALISLFAVFWRSTRRGTLRVLSVSLLLYLAAALMMYTLQALQQPALASASLLFLLTSVAVITLSVVNRIVEEKKNGTLPFLLVAFLASLLLSYVFAYYYEMSVILASHYSIELIGPAALFSLSQRLLILNAILFFAYALSRSRGSLRLNTDFALRVLLVPTIVVASLLAALLAMPTGSRFDMAQIVVMILIFILGFAIPKLQIYAYVIAFWFFLVGVLLLVEKSRLSKEQDPRQESVGILLVFFGGLLLPLIQYLMMGAVGTLLLSHRLSGQEARPASAT